jgi:hypothetical protein
LCIKLMRSMSVAMDDKEQVKTRWQRETLSACLGALALPSDLAMVKAAHLGKLRWTAGKTILTVVPDSADLKTLLSPAVSPVLKLADDPVVGAKTRFYSFMARTGRSMPQCAVLALAAQDHALRLTVPPVFCHTHTTRRPSHSKILQRRGGGPISASSTAWPRWLHF